MLRASQKKEYRLDVREAIQDKKNLDNVFYTGNDSFFIGSSREDCIKQARLKRMYDDNGRLSYITTWSEYFI